VKSKNIFEGLLKRIEKCKVFPAPESNHSFKSHEPFLILLYFYARPLC